MPIRTSVRQLTIKNDYLLRRVSLALLSDRFEKVRELLTSRTEAVTTRGSECSRNPISRIYRAAGSDCILSVEPLHFRCRFVIVETRVQEPGAIVENELATDTERSRIFHREEPTNYLNGMISSKVARKCPNTTHLWLVGQTYFDGILFNSWHFQTFTQFPTSAVVAATYQRTYRICTNDYDNPLAG